ncbi:CtrA inhibitor SciP [Roseicyclus sp.]|uniref:CtrA inhibitor SciP n=1 Tax=Roseicyclus sp. TaxID=1914329 RepID=UPI003F6C6EA0
MYIRKIPGPNTVRLPDGRSMTRADLPPAGTRRWVASRKAAVVTAVDAGLITEEEAINLWSLSQEELESWRAAVAQHGIAALRATALQQYRLLSFENFGKLE